MIYPLDRNFYRPFHPNECVKRIKNTRVLYTPKIIFDALHPLRLHPCVIQHIIVLEGTGPATIIATIYIIRFLTEASSFRFATAT